MAAEAALDTMLEVVGGALPSASCRWWGRCELPVV